MSDNTINSWSQVASTLHSLGQKNKQKKVIQNLRKINYRYSLEKQIQEHGIRASEEKKIIQDQRQKIIKSVEGETREQLNKKMDKLKIQQLYQVQNLNIMRKSSNTDLSFNSQNNQFFKLEDKNKKREMETKRNFQLQNLINNKQLEIKHKSTSKDQQKNVSFKQMYNCYIQKLYEKQQSDRQLWRNKYLYDKSIRQSMVNKSYKQAYRSYLKKQMDQKATQSNRLPQAIDEKLKSINQDIQNVNSSPAYLGIITQSFDRKKQMNLVDRSLHFEPKTIYERELMGKKQQASTKNIVRPQASLPELKQIKKKINFINSKQQIKQQQTKPIKKVREYRSYDFISGTQKTFFL